MTSADLQIKKLYKESVECVKYLDRVNQDSIDFASFFSSKTVTIRNKLCDYCEKILFLKPLVYGKRAEEIIWRKCFYEPIHKLRRSQQALSESDKCHYYMHITSAAGYYSSLLIKIQQEFYCEIPYSFDISPKQLPWNKTSKMVETSRSLHDFAFSLCHRVLVYLGDLARYQQELDHTSDLRLARHYYYWALRLKPFNGQPHNQLGTLYGDKNFGIDAAFCYLRCIFSAESFMGADGNLAQLLDKAKTSFKSLEEEFTRETGDGIKKSDEYEMQYCLTCYLTLFKLLYDDSEEKDASQELADLSPKFIKSYSAVVEIVVGSDEREHKRFCRRPLLKIFVCQLILIKKLQDKASYKSSASMALLISLIIVLLDRIIAILPERQLKSTSPIRLACLPKQNGCFMEHNKETIPATEYTDNPKTGRTTINKFTKNVDTKTKKINIRNFLQRRRRRSVEHSDVDDKSSVDDRNNNSSTENDDDEDDVVEIDDSDDADSDRASCDDDGGSSEKENVPQGDQEFADASREVTPGLVNCVEKGETNGVDSSESPSTQTPIPTVADTNLDEKIKDVVKFVVENDGIIVVIKIICDWLRSHPSLIISFGTVSAALWSQLFKFVNWLPNDDEIREFMKLDAEARIELECINICPASDFEQKYPLVEDVFLKGVPPLTQTHTGLDFEAHWSCSPNSQAISRILCIRSFTHSLIKLSLPNLVYDEESKMFLVEKVQPPSEECRKGEKKHQGADKNRRDALMRNMAKLRIKDEMKSIEKVAWIPVYLVLDSNCLLKSCITVKRLMSRRKFVLVVPASVLGRLDRLKKESVEAREAIRWLEVQLQSGNKYVRVQRSDETADVLSGCDDERAAAVLRDCVDSREVTGVVECAAYFSRSATSSASTVACILTDKTNSYKTAYKKNHGKDVSDDHDDKDKRKTNYKETFANLTEIAGLKGVSVENARTFLDRWSKHESFGKRGNGRRRRNS